MYLCELRVSNYQKWFIQIKWSDSWIIVPDSVNTIWISVCGRYWSSVYQFSNNSGIMFNNIVTIIIVLCGVFKVISIDQTITFCNYCFLVLRIFFYMFPLFFFLGICFQRCVVFLLLKCFILHGIRSECLALSKICYTKRLYGLSSNDCCLREYNFYTASY